jgi:hypothetical protein
MGDVTITVGGDIEANATCRSVDARHRAKRGEVFRECHLTFESWDALSRVLRSLEDADHGVLSSVDVSHPAGVTMDSNHRH